MKKKFLILPITIAVSGCLLLSSCIGSFSLSNKLLAWNRTIDDKFVNEIVFIAMWIVPVYEISIIADILVINSMEFWSGENPLEAGIVKKVQGTDGIYMVETLENGYRIENEKGQEVSLIYDKETNTWSAVANEQTAKLIKFENDDKAIVYLPSGEEKIVDLTKDGVLAFRQSVENAIYLANK